MSRPSTAFSFAPVALGLVALASCVSTDPVGDGTVGGSEGGGYDPVGAVGAVGGGDAAQGGSSASGSPVVCGDDVCDLDERCDLCPGDCGECTSNLVCGDGSCDIPDEDCDLCPDDCGACTGPGPVCGDGTCDASEDCETCSDDCGVCQCVDDLFEPNPGSPTATPVSRGVDYCDLSVCAGDVDWLEFTASSGFVVTLDFFHSDGDIDLQIFSEATGQYVTGSYSSTDVEVVSLPNAAAGTYWAQIYGADGAENRRYCFRVD